MNDNIELPDLPVPDHEDSLAGHYGAIQMMHYARAAVLADRERRSLEPVAWVEHEPTDPDEPDLTTDPLWAKHYPEKWRPLYAHPPAPAETDHRDLYDRVVAILADVWDHSESIDDSAYDVIDLISLPTDETCKAAQRLIHGFMLDCNAIGLQGAAENLHRGIKQTAAMAQQGGQNHDT